LTKDEALNRKADNARELGLDYEPMNTDESDEFDRIEREISMKGQPYIYEPKSNWIDIDVKDYPDIRYQSESFFAGVIWAQTKLKELNS